MTAALAKEDRSGSLAGARGIGRAAYAVVLLLISLPALAHDVTIAAHVAVQAPAAFYEFCAHNADACRPSGPTITAIRLTPWRLAELKAVTRRVNHSVTDTPDDKQYGRADVWAYPTNGKGDCEDFVLEKRRQLIAAGWPSSVLLITVVRDEKGDGHAVLTVPTNRGDLILDSRDDTIRRWSDTPYTFYTRQAASDPKSFVAIVDINPSARGVAAAEKRAAAAAAASAAAGKAASSNGKAGGNGRGAAASENAGSNGNAAGNSNAGGNGGGNSGNAGSDNSASGSGNSDNGSGNGGGGGNSGDHGR